MLIYLILWSLSMSPCLCGVFLWLKQACCKFSESFKVLPSCLWLNKFPEGIRLCVVWPRWIWASSARCSTRRRLSGRRRSSSLARWSTRCTSRLKPASTRASTSDRSLLHPKRKFRSANPILPMISLSKVVKLPKGEDFNDWLAVHVVDFFNRLDFYCQHDRKRCKIDPLSFHRINLIYGTVCEQCSKESCPTMSGGAKFEYLWQASLHKFYLTRCRNTDV